jgi:UPF0755 protein
MRIAIVFLMLLAVSGAGIAVLAANATRDGPNVLAFGSPGARDAAAGRSDAPPSQPSGTASETAPRPPAPGEVVTFTIQRGETTAAIAERLAQMGLVPNALLFRLWVQWRGAEGKLQAGEYQLRQGMTMDELVETLQAAKAKEVAITFVEGRRIEEFAETLEKADAGIDAARFLALAQRGSFAYDFLDSKPPSASLEGYLFPDTYRVIPGKTTPEELIHMMLKRFGDTLTPQMREQARRQNLTIHQFVTLASIVEREAQVKEERGLIAAVLLNRLRDKECLCADATIQYAIGRKGAWWPVLQDFARNIEPGSPYNTYTNAGLPPGPIANPGAAALKAVADPEKVDYKYYVRNDVKNDGSHVFARTLAEHEANIRRYQRLP